MQSSQSQKKTVKDLRVNANLTQRQVSRTIDVRESTVSDWERGIVEPRLPLRKVKQLIELYGCSFDELVEAFDQVPNVKSNDDSDNLIKCDKVAA